MAHGPEMLGQIEASRAVRVMIVEDDVTMEPLWRYIVEMASPGGEVDWMTSAEAAESRLRTQSYDLVISDIFLNGEKTGVDLWETVGHENFLLMSVLSPSRLATLTMAHAKSLPPYLQKPLDPTQCIESVRALLQFKASPGEE